MKSRWKLNTAGLVNFQDQDAESNPGTKLEVTVTAAACNATACLCKETNMTFTAFLIQFAAKLEVMLLSEGLEKMLYQDGAFDFNVPRFLFPGVKGSCGTGDLIGFVELMKN